ncbi:MAG TPA: ATP-binding cassette domain-containing protein [Candidatus Acidoferrales bacterium]
MPNDSSDKPASSSTSQNSAAYRGVSPTIEMRGVSYQLPNGHSLLRDLDLTVNPSETLVLLGRSGAGKSTALKLINRMLELSHGEILVEGKSIKDWNPIALRRHIGYVIQDIGLFPHYTVEKNISLVPQLEGWTPDRIRARVEELMKLVGLDAAKFSKRFPHELSGGQRQRVGIARALAADPPILLMDEPFGALDPLTRGELQREFQSLEHLIRKTIVVVTHHVGEALLLGDRIGVIEAGALVGMYSPKEFLAATEPVAAAYVANLRMYQQAEEGL